MLLEAHEFLHRTLRGSTRVIFLEWIMQPQRVSSMTISSILKRRLTVPCGTWCLLDQSGAVKYEQRGQHRLWPEEHYKAQP